MGKNDDKHIHEPAEGMSRRTCNAGSVEARCNAHAGRSRERRRVDRSLVRAQAVATSSACCKPSNSIAWTRITYFWTLPVTVIGNSSTT